MDAEEATLEHEPIGAVFLSYASQDEQAAQRICEALQQAHVEVWFDRTGLRGGDTWDATIRRQIRTCTLFIPIISRNTHLREEGYFRLEWKLAIDRSYLIAASKPFLLPVVIDDTPRDDERVPDRFRELQWTMVPDGVSADTFAKQIVRLLSRDPQAAPTLGKSQDAEVPVAPAASPLAANAARIWRRFGPLVLGVVVVLVLSAAVVWFMYVKHAENGTAMSLISGARGLAAAPQQSIAVLPFVDMSQEKDQEYFSDGLSEELIDLLSRIPTLRVPARTSSFFFKGKAEKIATIAADLGVAHILEGSVRKAGNTLRVTAQLIRADNGYHVWSQTYDRELKDVFQVQDDIATAVVAALKVKLMPGQLGLSSHSTSNADAYNLFLLGLKLHRDSKLDDLRHAIEAFRGAIALDPSYAAAYAKLALSTAFLADQTGDMQGIEEAAADADKAVALAPDEAAGYVARGYIHANWKWDWEAARTDFETALALDANDSSVQLNYAGLLASIGRLPEAIAAAQRAVALDPMSDIGWENLGKFLLSVRENAAAANALHRALDFQPHNPYSLSQLGAVELLDGNFSEALTTFSSVSLDGYRQVGIAMAEHSLGQLSKSQQALAEAIAKAAQEAAYQIAGAYAWNGDRDKAFEWLDRAYKQRDGGLADIKFDPLFDSLRGDPRYRAFLRKMRLPE